MRQRWVLQQSCFQPGLFFNLPFWVSCWNQRNLSRRNLVHSQKNQLVEACKESEEDTGLGRLEGGKRCLFSVFRLLYLFLCYFLMIWLFLIGCVFDGDFDSGIRAAKKWSLEPWTYFFIFSSKKFILSLQVLESPLVYVVLGSLQSQSSHRQGRNSAPRNQHLLC